MTPEIFILLPVHNRREVTRRFLECLQAQSTQHFHPVIVDDGSSDGTAEMALELFPEATILHGDGNLWWAGSLQKCFIWLKDKQPDGNDVVLIINDDTNFEPDFLETALSILATKQRTLLLAYCYSLQTLELIDSGVHVEWRNLSHRQAKTVEEINCLSTRGLFMRISDFFEIGDFHPRLLPHYASDYEYTIRAYKKGFTLISDKSLQLFCDQSTTGVHATDTNSIRSLASNLFSYRSSENPLVWSSYILLACPVRWIPINLYRIWFTVAKLFLRAFIQKLNKLR